MALNPRSTRKAFKPSPYHTHRNSRGLPRWLILLVLGILIGSGGVILLQTSYGPKRLTVLESEKLTSDFTTLTLKEQTQQNTITTLTGQLKSSQTASEALIAEAQNEILKLKKQIEPAEQTLTAFKQALAANLKFEPVAISADTFTQSKQQASINFQLLFVQDPKDKTDFEGSADITFEGRYPNGRAGAIKTPLLPLLVNSHQLVQGGLEFPAGFIATKGTVRVYKRDSTRALGWRTFNIEQVP
jgi:hypothetical protein